MRKTLTAIMLSTLFAAAPAFAAKTHVARRAPKTAPVAGDAKPAPAEGGAEAKPEVKPTKKKAKSTKKMEEKKEGETKSPEPTPAK